MSLRPSLYLFYQEAKERQIHDTRRSEKQSKSRENYIANIEYFL